MISYKKCAFGETVQRRVLKYYSQISIRTTRSRNINTIESIRKEFRIRSTVHNLTLTTQGDVYRVFQKTDTEFYFWDNFGNSAPILTILSLLHAKIYGP